MDFVTPDVDGKTAGGTPAHDLFACSLLIICLIYMSGPNNL